MYSIDYKTITTTALFGYLGPMKLHLFKKRGRFWNGFVINKLLAQLVNIFHTISLIIFAVAPLFLLTKAPAESADLL